MLFFRRLQSRVDRNKTGCSMDKIGGTEVTESLKIKEADLFEPVQEFFQELGYSVKGEVGNCDIMAIRGEEILVVELKKGITIGLLAQAVDRQRIGDLVYMAVPKPKKFKIDREFKRILHLVRRLELGLLFVSFTGKKPKVEVIVEAQSFDRGKSKVLSSKKRGKLKAEHENRKNSSNIGGVNKTKILTAYRERAIEAALYLSEHGVSKVAVIKKAIQYDKIGALLNANHYGWFFKEAKGYYRLSESGERGLKDYEDYVKNLK